MYAISKWTNGHLVEWERENFAMKQCVYVLLLLLLLQRAYIEYVSFYGSKTPILEIKKEKSKHARTSTGEKYTGEENKPLPLMMTLYCYVLSHSFYVRVCIYHKRIDLNTCTKWINTAYNLHTLLLSLLRLCVDRSFIFFLLLLPFVAAVAQFVF